MRWDSGSGPEPLLLCLWGLPSSLAAGAGAAPQGCLAVRASGGAGGGGGRVPAPGQCLGVGSVPQQDLRTAPNQQSLGTGGSATSHGHLGDGRGWRVGELRLL